MSLKHVGTISFMGLLLAGVFFGTKAYGAVSIYQTTLDATDTYCRYHSGGGMVADPTCTGTPSALSGLWSIGQELWITQGSGIPEVELTSANLYTEGCGAGTSPTTGTGYLLNEADYDNFVANSYAIASARATSTAVNIECGAATGFTFTTPFKVTATSTVTWFIVEGTYAADKTVPLWRVHQSVYPDNGFPDLVNGGAQFSGNDQYPEFSSVDDLEFTLFNGLNPLTITSPPHLGVVDNFFTIAGACNDEVNLRMYNEVSATPEFDYYFPDITCSANTWNAAANLTGTENGTWFIDATSTNNQLALRTFILNDDVNTTSDDVWSDAIASTSEAILRETFGDTFAPFAKGLIENIETLRPYSYITELVGTYATSMANASATPWFEGIELDYGSGTFVFPNIDTALFSHVDATVKTNIRTISTLVFSAVFVMYVIWPLRKRIL